MSLKPAEISIKHHIAQHPTMFTSRWSVLVHLLLRDGSYNYWLPDGRLASNDVSFEDVSDLKLKIGNFINAETDVLHQEIDPSGYAATLVERDMENINLSFMEKNLDIFASKNLSFQKPICDKDFKAISSNACLWSAHVDIEPSWLMAVNEFLTLSTKYMLANHYHSHDFTKEQMDNELNWSLGIWFDLYHQMKDKQCEIYKSDELDVNPEAKALISDMWNSMMEKTK